MTSLNRKTTRQFSTAILGNSLRMGILEKLTFGMGAFGIGLFALGIRAMPVNAAPSTDLSPALLQSTADTIPVSSPEVYRADQLANQGVAAFTQGNQLAAFDYWQQAMLLYRVADESTKEARMLENLSVVYRLTERPAEAINMSQQAISIYDALGTTNEQPSAFLNLGSAYRSAGQSSEAIATYTRGLYLYRQNADTTGERIILSLLADVHAELEEYTQSIAYQQQVLAIAQRTGDHQSQAEADRKSTRLNSSH